MNFFAQQEMQGLAEVPPLTGIATPRKESEPVFKYNPNLHPKVRLNNIN